MIASGIKPVDHKDIPEYMAFICYDESFSCFVILSGFARSILFEYSSDGTCLSVRAKTKQNLLPVVFTPVTERSYSGFTIFLYSH